MSIWTMLKSLFPQPLKNKNVNLWGSVPVAQKEVESSNNSNQ